MVTVTGSNSAGPFTAADGGDGTYTTSYTPSAAGTDNVAITMNGTALNDSPYTSVVSAGALSPANSTATVPAGTAGSATNITVQARDASGNPLTTTGATVLVTVTGSNSAGPFTAADGGDGTYTTSYTPSAAGTDNVAITMNGTALNDSPYTSVVSAGALSPANSTATVPAGTAGSATNITVQARDASGNPLTTTGATVLVTVTGSNSAGPFTAADGGDGTYTTSYTPSAAGTDNVAITMNGTALNDSPYTSVVSAGALSPANSTATVPAGTAGSATNITVQARDASGNPLTTTGATVLVTVTGSNSAGPFTAADGGDGTYTTSYTPSAAGTDNVAITMNGTALNDSPYTSVVSAGAATQYLVTSSSYSVPAGGNVTITAQLADANGNPVSTPGQTITWGSTNGGSFSPATSDTDGSGQATVTFTTDVTAGTVEVTATTGGITGTSPTITTTAPQPLSVSAPDARRESLPHPTIPDA